MQHAVFLYAVYASASTGAKCVPLAHIGLAEPPLRNDLFIRASETMRIP